MNWHAPPPGAPTGVADYAETLRRALGDIPADVDIYHLGNNGLHAEIYARSLRKPGIVVVHDAVLHHFYLGSLSEQQYVDEFVHNYGEWRRDLGRDLWRERGASAVDIRYFQYPMLRRAVECSRAVIVHNSGAAAMAKEHGAVRVHVIPHFFEPRPAADAAAIALFREHLGVAPGVTLFGIFGYLRETKRLLPCIKAFRRLHAVRPNTALFIAGDVVSPDLRRLLANEATHPAIHRRGHLSDDDFWLAAAAVDCCLNLRYPPAGETSGIAIRLMGIGKPVILTEGPETDDIPNEACLRVPSGIDEEQSLFDQMAFINEFPALARRIGHAAKSYIQTHHSLESTVQQYRELALLINGY